MSSNQPHQGAGEVEESEEVAGELLEAHGDAAEAFDSLEEALDEASLFVEMPVDRALACTVGFGWDDDRAAVLLEHLDEGRCVVSFVASDEGVGDVAQELVRELHLVGLARREGEAHGVTQRVDDRVDLGGRTSA